jgi:hypothetical protein
MAVGDLAHDDASLTTWRIGYLSPEPKEVLFVESTPMNSATRARIPTLAPFLNTYQAYANTVPKFDSLTLNQNDQREPGVTVSKASAWL